MMPFFVAIAAIFSLSLRRCLRHADDAEQYTAVRFDADIACYFHALRC